jgi:hypothetical protein
MSSVESVSVTRPRETQMFCPEIMPEEWKDRFQGLQVVRTKDGHEKLYGVAKDSDKKTELTWKPLERGVEQAYGVLPQRWTEEEYGQNPQLANAVIENALLRTELNFRQYADAEKDASIRRLEGENELRKREIQSLKDELADLRSESVSGARPAAVSTPVDHGAQAAADTPSATGAEAQTGTPGRSEPESTDERAQQREHLRRRGNAVNPPIGDRDVGVDEVRVRSPDNGRWNRFREKLGGIVLGSQVRAQSGVFRVMDRRNRRAIENNEIIEYQSEQERRAGTAALVGIAAVIGTAVVVWWLAKHTGHDHSSINNEINNIKGQNDQLLSEVNSMKDQLDKDGSAIGRMSARIAELKRSVGLNHQLLLDLKHQEAKEAVSGSSGRISGGTHTEYLSYRGDTVWSHARRLIERRTDGTSSTELIRHVTSKILSLNGLRWNGGGPGVDAHQLPLGMQLRVPNRIA